MKEAIKHTLEAFWLRHKQLLAQRQANHKSPLLAEGLNQFELFGYDFMVDENS